uniref:Uncharacterized protein n=1 Tax=Arundo donax TaxID=35708 RepID=A0A0A9CFD6_ARUDO
MFFGTSPKGFVRPDNSFVLLFRNKENIAPEVTPIRRRPHATAMPATAPVLSRDFPLPAAPVTGHTMYFIFLHRQNFTGRDLII